MRHLVEILMTATTALKNNHDPQLSMPIALALLAGAASGRRIGEEAETIARGLKP